MSDLDLRLVRSFAVVAEHRHFGRAAAELHLTQSSLSRQIGAAGAAGGCPPAGSHPAGHAAHRSRRGRSSLLAADPAAGRGARGGPRAGGRAAQPDQRRLHREPDRHAGGARAAPPPPRRRGAHPAPRRGTDARAALLEHRVDVAVVRLPLRAAGLHVTVLYDEPRVLLLPSDHRLAGKESVHARRHRGRAAAARPRRGVGRGSLARRPAPGRPPGARWSAHRRDRGQDRAGGERAGGGDHPGGAGERHRSPHGPDDRPRWPTSSRARWRWRRARASATGSWRRSARTAKHC